MRFLDGHMTKGSEPSVAGSRVRGMLRQAAGRFASGVTVVTTKAPDGAYGVTVSSFASLSLNPLLVTVSDQPIASPLLGIVRAAGAFAVSVLASERPADCRLLRKTAVGSLNLLASTVATTAHETGAPIIDGCAQLVRLLGRGSAAGWRPRDPGRPGGSAGGRRGEPLVYWAGEFRALSADMPRPDQMANASDGLAVAYHVLDVDPAEMLDAQNSIEPAIAALAAGRTPSREWDRLEQLVDQSELVVEEPDEFNRLALAFHSAIAHACRKSSATGNPRQPQPGAIHPLPGLRKCSIGSRGRRRTSAVARRTATRRSRSGPR